MTREEKKAWVENLTDEKLLNQYTKTSMRYASCFESAKIEDLDERDYELKIVNYDIQENISQER